MTEPTRIDLKGRSMGVQSIRKLTRDLESILNGNYSVLAFQEIILEPRRNEPALIRMSVTIRSVEVDLLRCCVSFKGLVQDEIYPSIRLTGVLELAKKTATVTFADTEEQ